MNIRRLPRALAATTAIAVLTGCGAGPGSTAANDGAASPTLTRAVTVADALADNIPVETGDTSEDGDAVDLDLPGVAEDGTVTISEPGTYRLHGELEGQVVVDSAARGAVRLVLDDASITSSSGAAIHVVDAESVVVVLVAGTTNTLTDAATYADTSEDAPTGALYSTADLTIGGTGTLLVIGNANNGIVGKDGLVLAGGDIDVTSVDDGIIGKDYLVVTGADVSVDAADDGLKSDNTTDAGTGFVLVEDGSVEVTSRDDAIKGTQVLVSGGSVDVAGSTEAVEGSVIIVDDGTLELRSADDGVNAASSADSTDSETGPGAGSMAADESLRIVVNGGSLEVWSSGDGIDSNGTATITGGTVTVHGPTSAGNGALDVNGDLDVSGGTLLATGSAGMVVAPSTTSTQGWLATAFTSTVGSGSRVVVSDENGDEVVAFTAQKDLASLVHSSPDIESGATYTVTAGGTTSTVTAGENPAGGHAPAGR